MFFTSSLGTDVDRPNDLSVLLMVHLSEEKQQQGKVIVGWKVAKHTQKKKKKTHKKKKTT